MSCQEQQEEEVEVLTAIYEGDVNFKQLNPTTYRYKCGEDGGYKSFLLEISWGESYPEDAPNINLDLFYNKHLLSSVKDNIVDGISQQVEDLLGCAMTYTLFEWVKENWESLLESQPETPQVEVREVRAVTQEGKEEEVGKKKEKKEQLTKSQKRKIINRLDDKGEIPRGHDWVDIVKHLSQTGFSNIKSSETS